MTREEAIALAKAHAVEAAKKPYSHGYLIEARQENWQPHAWVVNAIMAAAAQPQKKEE